MDRYRRLPGGMLQVALATFLLLSLPGAGIGAPSSAATDVLVGIVDHDAAEAETACLVPTGVLPGRPALRASRVSAAPHAMLDATHFRWDAPPRAPPDPIRPV